jgi:ribonuclease BN (tRNA processing enzyme)
VVYSGDTNPKQNLIFNSQNVDLLIHEIYGWYRWVAPALFDYHTDPEGFAEVMNATKPKLAVMNHIAVAGNSDWGYDTTDKLVTAVRDFGYGGPLEVGQDLMTIDVTTSGIVSDRSSVPVGIEENTRGMLPELLRRVP